MILTTGPLVANVPDAETQFHAHEFLDATVQPKPIYISPNEIYTMHGLLSQHQDSLVRSIRQNKTILKFFIRRVNPPMMHLKSF